MESAASRNATAGSPAAQGLPGPGRRKIESRGVQSIDVGGRLLQVLVEQAQPMMLRDIARGADVTAAQAHGYLASFRKLGMVEQDPASGRYLLGPFALKLGLARLRAFSPTRLASAAIPELAENLGLMAALAVWGSQGPTIVQVHEGGSQVNANVRPGAVFSVSGTATGRLFAAYLPRRTYEPLVVAERREGPGPRRIGVPAGRADLKLRLTQIRALRYEITEGAPIPGINAIAAPVFDHSGQLQLAVTLVGNDYYMDVSPGSRFLAALLAATEGLSAALGYRPPADAAQVEDTGAQAR